MTSNWGIRDSVHDVTGYTRVLRVVGGIPIRLSYSLSRDPPWDPHFLTFIDRW